MTDQPSHGDQPAPAPQPDDREQSAETEQSADTEPTMPLAMPLGWVSQEQDAGPQPPEPTPVAPPGWYDTQWSAAPPPPPAQHSGSAPGWLWPAIVALALVVGLAGGALGGALYQGLNEESRGLDPARTRNAPPLAEGNESISAVAEELLPSTVQILAGTGDSGATGSGFVLDADGHVITNHHVVAGVAGDDGALRVVDFEGRSYEASVVGASQVYDLAVLELVDGEALRAASLGAARSLLVGDPVVAFGAPLGLSQTVTSGIVSALNRPVTTGDSGEDDTSFINAVQTDAAINPGNSGGPLVNLAGQVVGVNSAIATTGGLMREAGSIGVGFAIPIEQVRTTADQILRTGEARYPVIGAQVQTRGDTELRGARIDKVLDDSPAARAGLDEDDVVIAVDGVRIADGISLIVSIRTHQPGETVTFTVLRDGDERELDITLDSEVG